MDEAAATSAGQVAIDEHDLPAVGRSVHLFRRSARPAPDKTVQTYAGFRHETLRESGRETVLADLLAWLRARVLPV